MYCSVVYGYRNEFASYLNSMPGLYGGLLEQLAEVHVEHHNYQNPLSEGMRQRVLYCGALVSLPVKDWGSWNTRGWRATISALKGAQPRSLKDVEAHIREELCVAKAEYLLSHARGAEQVRGLLLLDVEQAAAAALRVCDRVERCMSGDEVAATMVGTNTFVFLRHLPRLTGTNYMEFFEQLLLIGEHR
jgi:hypothetical protein